MEINIKVKRGHNYITKSIKMNSQMRIRERIKVGNARLWINEESINNPKGIEIQNKTIYIQAMLAGGTDISMYAHNIRGTVAKNGNNKFKEPLIYQRTKEQDIVMLLETGCNEYTRAEVCTSEHVTDRENKMKLAEKFKS